MMSRTDLNRLQVFAAVVEAGSFTAAAARMGMTKSQVSVQVARLEAELGQALFTRSTRRVAATEAGLQLYAESAPLLVGLQGALARLASTGELTGRLRITAGASYSDGVLGTLLAEFATRHPRLDVELIASDIQLDLLAEGIDVAIRGGTLRDSSLRAVRLGSFLQVPVASPGLFERMGRPNEPAQLNGQPWVALTVLGTPLTWHFTHPDGRHSTVRTRAAMRVNSARVARECARAGVGGAVLPDYLVREDLTGGRLVALLPEWQLPVAGIYAVYPGGPYPPAKTRAFIDFLRGRIRGDE